MVLAGLTIVDWVGRLVSRSADWDGSSSTRLGVEAVAIFLAAAVLVLASGKSGVRFRTLALDGDGWDADRRSFLACRAGRSDDVARAISGRDNFRGAEAGLGIGGRVSDGDCLACLATALALEELSIFAFGLVGLDWAGDV